MLKTGLVMRLPAVSIETPKIFKKKIGTTVNMILLPVYCKFKLIFKEADYG
jgi:hypothetical protein